MTALLAGAASIVAVALLTEVAPDPALLTGRLVLLTAGGALCFGAGLLRIATGHIRHRRGVDCRGAVLVVAGLLIASATQLVRVWHGPLTHAATSWAFVSAAVWAALATLVMTTCLSGFLGATAAEEARLSSAETALRTAIEASITQHQQQRDLTHDARNALCALRMATTTLSQVGERLDAETRGQLRGAMLQEVGHLDELISRTAAQRPALVGVAKERQSWSGLPAQRQSVSDQGTRIAV